jgi:N-acetylglucosaminylphosphatidylinositol deacetylase
MGISPSHVTLMNVTGLQDGQIKWETEKLARIVLQHVEKLDIEVILTFDDNGVSAHPNHISCFHAMQFLYSNGMLPSDVQIFVLESVSLFRKYIGVLDIYASFFSSTFIVLASPLNSWSAMREHKSQLVWFRYLYIIFSRYILVNTFKRISLHRFMISEKNKKYH